MSDKLAEVLIAAARGIVAAQGGAGAKTPATPASTAQPSKPATTTTKPAATTTKPATTKPATTKPAAAAPAKVGKYDIAQVRDLVRKVAIHDALGKVEASNILDEEAGVQQVSQLKPADYDKVAEACLNALKTAGGQTEAEEAPAEEFDPTA